MKKNIFIFVLLINIFLSINVSYAKEHNFQIKYYGDNNAFNTKNNIKNNRYNSIKEDNLPSCYNSISKGYITSVKEQGNDSTCWSFATMSAIESSLIKNNNCSKNIDLSEAQLTYLSFNKIKDPLNLINLDYNQIINGEKYLNVGGNYYLSMFSLASGYGVMKEDKMKYNTLKTNSFNKNTILDNDFTLKNCYMLPMSDINEIKKCIIKYGSVASEYYNDKKNINTKNYAYYQNKEINTNHAISIVGWSDNYPKKNFKTTPKNNGAWLVKNSWGIDWGLKGYFWISYEDTSIMNGNAVCFEMNEDKYLNRYQYDGTASTSYLYNKYSLYQSNIYTAQTNEILSNVGFFTDTENLFYEIKVYKNVKNTPTDGTLMNVYIGNTTYAGYHLVELSDKILLNKGDKFSIVIQIKDVDGNPSYVLIDSDSKWGSWLRFVNYSNPGESFVSENGTDWIDIGLKLNANCRIKALTKPIYNISINKSSPQTINSDIKFTINSNKNNLEYKYVINNTTYGTKTQINNQNNVTYIWKPTKKGNYMIYVYITDTETSRVLGISKYNFKITDLYIKKINVKKIKYKKGYYITTNTVTTSGYGTKQYSYIIKNTKGKIIKSKKYSKTNSYKVFLNPGTYYIISQIKDSSGYVTKKQVKVKI